MAVLRNLVALLYEHYLRHRLLAVASPMAQDVVGMSPMAAASMVGLIGLLNGAGRIAWATVSDYIGRSSTYVLFFAIEILAFWQLANVTSAFSFQILLLLIILAMAAVFPACRLPQRPLWDQVSQRHSRPYLDGLGGCRRSGPVLVSIIKETTNSYATTLYFFVGAFVVALVLMAFLKYQTRHGIETTAQPSRSTGM